MIFITIWTGCCWFSATNDITIWINPKCGQLSHDVTNETIINVRTTNVSCITGLWATHTKVTHLSFTIRNCNKRFLGYGMKNSIRSRLGHCSLTHCVASLNLKHITIKCFLQRYAIPNLSLSGSRRQVCGTLISVPCQLDNTQHYDNKIRTSLPVIQGYNKY